MLTHMLVKLESAQLGDLRICARRGDNVAERIVDCTEKKEKRSRVKPDFFFRAAGAA